MSRLQTAVRDIAVAPAAGLFALGGAINTATGGTTPTYNIWKALRGHGADEVAYSDPILAASLVRGQDVIVGEDPNDVERQIRLQLPLLNPAGAKMAGDVLEDATGFVAEAVGGAAEGAGAGLFKGLGLRGGLLLAGAGTAAFFLLRR